MRLFGAGAATAAKGVHLALVAESRAAVDAFFAAAVAAGVDIYTLRGFGGEYRVYCAFMSDSDGSNIEAVHKETQ